MIIPFYKMTGAGNDFVMVDNRDLALSHILTRENIARLCNRRFGIGADGLIAIEPPQIKADVRMRYYNADGGKPKCAATEPAVSRHSHAIYQEEKQRLFASKPWQA